MQAYEELFQLASVLDKEAKKLSELPASTQLDALETAANKLKSSFSGSWLGYHAHVYYKDLLPAPPGVHFSQEWGLMDVFGDLSSHGQWHEYDPAWVRQKIEEKAGNVELKTSLDAMEEAAHTFDKVKSDIVSILSSEVEQLPDNFLTKQLEAIEPMECLTPMEIANRWNGNSRIMTRDTTAIGQGTRVPPHIMVLAEIRSIRHPFQLCQQSALIARKAASHLERKMGQRKSDNRVGTNVFIGHGRSSEWRVLKDFISERLALPYDEFNRVPVAGITNISRLSEMLDAAAIALVIMTAEDERADGKNQARMNVIHEVGLFQGRLGFTKAIVILEDGCEEFSNIQGLGQLRFPTGQISAIFEKVRELLEREGLVE